MTWIVLGEAKEKVLLVSKGNVNGILPKGSYLTVMEGDKKFILRVEQSEQYSPYSPSPMIIDMELAPLVQDQKWQNVVKAYRVKDISDRSDGLIDPIRPQLTARRSTQEEIDAAFGNITAGPDVFIATIHNGQNQHISDEKGIFIKAKLPEEMFYYQVLICGKTGAGKTVSAKYLAQYFVEELEGAVLAVNVKDVDLLKMDLPSETKNKNVIKEWDEIGQKAHSIDNFVIYYPANAQIPKTKKVTATSKKVTLDVHKIEPEALVGLLQGITDAAAQSLPNIFRYWQQEKMGENGTFEEFKRYFENGRNENLLFDTLNSRGEQSQIPLHRGTFDSIQRKLDAATDFFDNPDAETLDSEDILVPGKMSVIDVANKNGILFGSILLRQLLDRIVLAKSEGKSDVPILIMIDEVHQFYDSDSTREALGALDTISRTGRSQRIGVVFLSQNPSDMPRGLFNVINTKIFFKSESDTAKKYGLSVSSEEIESLKAGFAVASIYEVPQLKFLKFPLAFAGVFEKGR